jgi:hypothetical protein
MESQPIGAFNTLKSQDFPEVSLFCNWLLQPSPTKRYMLLQRTSRKIAQVLIARSEATVVKSLAGGFRRGWRPVI